MIRATHVHSPHDHAQAHDHEHHHHHDDGEDCECGHDHHPRPKAQAMPDDSVVLDFDGRHRRRVVMTGVKGTTFLLDLKEAVVLRGGDMLHLEDGRHVEVVAAPEPLAEVRAADATALARLAWHLGNRHLPVQILPNRIRLRRDPVIEEMLKGQGARVAAIEAPFDPEGGAYAGAGHDHAGHDHGHDRHGQDRHGHDHHAHEHHGHDHSGHAHKHG